MCLSLILIRNYRDSDVTCKIEIDKLDSRLQAEELKNEVLKQKLNDYEMQIELSNSKINVFKL